MSDFDPTRQIAIYWDIDDVKSRVKALTDGQCMEVLNRCRKNHDSEQGISWSTIDFWINELFGLAPDEDSEEDEE